MDQIYPNSNVCPRLNTVAAQAYSTPEFTAENTSDYIETLNQNLTDIFGANMWSWNNVLDCLMTTVCTDRPIPDGSLDAGSIMTDTIFNATVAQSEFMYAFQSLYNNSQWSKLAMGQVSWHIRNNIENMINPPVGVTPYKMAVFSGHDTTIMPFLAAVLGDSWDRRWASYAALISMELYTRSATSTIAGDSDYLVRMVYNGNPLLIPGCDQALCDANVLLEILSFGEESMPCSTTTTTTTIPTDDSCIDSGGLDVVAWSLLVVFLTLAGGIAGVIGTLIATGRFHESTSVVVAKGESNPIHGRSASTGANDSVPLEL